VDFPGEKWPPPEAAHFHELKRKRVRRELWGKGEEGEKSFTPYGNPLTQISKLLFL
jgi:hypothetical protein